MHTEIKRESRSDILTILLLLTAFCWAFVLTGAGTGMNIWTMTTSQFPPSMDIPKKSMAWSWEYAVTLLGMWWIMMVGMMLPGAIIGVKGRSLRTTREGVRFFANYCGIWFIFSIIAVIMQLIAEKFDYLHPMNMWSINTEFSFVILIMAGMYQFSHTKQSALERCKSAPVIDGVHYGLHCMMASSPLMLLLFVGGIMNLVWIAGLSAVVTIEKYLAQPQSFSSAVGIGILALATKVFWI